MKTGHDKEIWINSSGEREPRKFQIACSKNLSGLNARAGESSFAVRTDRRKTYLLAA